MIRSEAFCADWSALDPVEIQGGYAQPPEAHRACHPLACKYCRTKPSRPSTDRDHRRLTAPRQARGTAVQVLRTSQIIRTTRSTVPRSPPPIYMICSVRWYGAAYMPDRERSVCGLPHPDPCSAILAKLPLRGACRQAADPLTCVVERQCSIAHGLKNTRGAYRPTA
jgi:hypothetical protein